MEPGTVVADRFVVEALVGSGGMGTVYRVKDRQHNGLAAIKILHQTGPSFVARFAEEAKALEALRHPGIVRYLSHGTTPEGLHYIATEWLDGEDLAQRLARAPMAIHDCVTLALKTAEALAAAHAGGIIHRDVKPTNLFLEGGDIARVKLLDFGVARHVDSERPPTSTGILVGTPGYMAPEQARGQRILDARIDVFSLGAVVYECLTGIRPFPGDDILAVLAKVLLDEAPPVRDLRPDTPLALDRLVHRMLQKDPSMRPRDARAVLDELQALAGFEVQQTDAAAMQVPGLTSLERRLMFVIVTSSDREGAGSALGATVSRFGGILEQLVDGTGLVLLTGSGSATDQAAHAARCALAVRAVMPNAAIALAAGRVVREAQTSVSTAIDRAVRLLRNAEVGPTPATTGTESLAAATVVGPHAPRVTESATVRLSAETDAPGIRLDDATASLLDAQFEIGGDALGLELLRERPASDPARTLLGRATPHVGRDADLHMLARLLDDCTSAPAARAVLVTGDAGIGKSRLRHEFLQTVRTQHTKVRVWMARGDPMYAGSPFWMAAQIIVQAVGIREGEPLVVRQRKLRARMARSFDDLDLARISAFLGEMVGAPFAGEDRPDLRAARADAVLMGDQIQRAWENWIAAELAEGPMLLVLEDLHWGDAPSIRLCDGVLRHLAERPLMILALARPDIQRVFPNLWSERALTSMRLGPLSRRASEQLVQIVLGTQLSTAAAARVVEQSAGNAYYLEELIRAAAENRNGGDQLPETVLAMTQARIEALEKDARQLLRAASVFGNTFWAGGTGALLAGNRALGSLKEWCDELHARELIVRREGSRFPGEREYSFRHAFVRDAAYSMLTEDDRALGHRLAGAWLEKLGEKDARVLAGHFEQGCELKRAAKWYRRAAEQALEGNDFAGVLDCVQRAVTCGVDDVSLGGLWLLEAEARRWRGEFTEAHRAGADALRVLPRNSAGWYRAAGEIALSCGQSGDAGPIEQVAQAIDHAPQVGEPGLVAAQATAWARAAVQLFALGRVRDGDRMLERIRTSIGPSGSTDPATHARISAARAVRTLGDGDLARYIELRSLAVQGFEQAGDLRSACSERANLAYGYMQVGAYDDARRALRSALGVAERLGIKNTIALLQHNLGLALARLGAVDDGRALEAAAVQAFAAQGNRRMEGGARIYAAMIELASGDFASAEAERQARIAVQQLASFEPLLAYAQATLAAALLAQDKSSEALSFARDAFLRLTTSDFVEDGEALVRLTYAEVAFATGDIAAAWEAIVDARERVQKRALAITNPAWRKGFLESVPEHARTLARAQEWESRARSPIFAQTPENK